MVLRRIHLKIFRCQQPLDLLLKGFFCFNGKEKTNNHSPISASERQGRCRLAWLFILTLFVLV